MALTSPSPSPAIVMTTLSRVQKPPPISFILPFLTSVLSTGSSALPHAISLFNIVLAYILSPLLVVIPVIIYIISPIVISSQLLLDAFVFLPYRAVLFILQAIHPIYTFLVVACLSGAIVGMGARQIVIMVGCGLLGEMQTAQRSASPSRSRPQRGTSARGKRKVAVKTED
ncbi:hypothetical protein B0F90DRAFT_1824754 [Multifurca ochricompacta]|uniref:Uncharacterized protein n=1 Tax=Multifurca ochricompacta TaxID=376703 RepID=A0AAD4LWY9_9AGAM|nr:hypothetical protein B0F90DRAFT_1824754 [Multifurca ochricompacta]